MDKYRRQRRSSPTEYLYNTPESEQHLGKIEDFTKRMSEYLSTPQLHSLSQVSRQFSELGRSKIQERTEQLPSLSDILDRDDGALFDKVLERDFSRELKGELLEFAYGKDFNVKISRNLPGARKPFENIFIKILELYPDDGQILSQLIDIIVQKWGKDSTLLLNLILSYDKSKRKPALVYLVKIWKGFKYTSLIIATPDKFREILTILVNAGEFNIVKFYEDFSSRFNFETLVKYLRVSYPITLDELRKVEGIYSTELISRFWINIDWEQSSENGYVWAREIYESVHNFIGVNLLAEIVKKHAEYKNTKFKSNAWFMEVLKFWVALDNTFIMVEIEKILIILAQSLEILPDIPMINNIFPRLQEYFDSQAEDIYSE